MADTRSKKPKIIIKELGLENFGPYSNYESLKFSMDPVKNVTLIKGGNNAGKTNLFQALLWILFPGLNEQIKKKEMQYLRSQDTINVVNIDSIKNTNIGQDIHLKGVIEFIYQTSSKNRTDYVITRTRKYKKIKDFDTTTLTENNNSEVLEYIPNSDNFVVTKNGKKITDINEYYRIINDFFPPAIRTFVFIHGEGMTRILSIENVAKLRDSVLSISDFDRIESLHSYLEACKSYFDGQRKKLNKGDQELEKREKRINDCKKLLDDDEENLIKNEEKFATHEKKYLEVKDELDKLGRIEQLAKNYNEIKDQINDQNQSLNDLKKEREDILMENVPLLFLEDAIKLCRENLKRKRELGIIPGRLIPKEALEVILKNPSICVCETPWTKSMKDAIQKLISDSHSSNTITEVNKFEGNLQVMEENLTKGKKDIIKIEGKYTDKLEEIDLLKKKIENLDRLLSPEQKSSQWYKEIQALNDKRDKYHRRMAMVEERINSLKSSIKEKKEKVEELENAYTDYEHSHKKKMGGKDSDYYLDICNYVEILDKVGADILNNLERRIREATRNETEKILKKLVKNPRDWDSINIKSRGTGWEINANHQGKQIINLAGGMTNILGLSFIFALSKILGVDLPLIFDSPLVYLDEEVRELVCDKLPPIFEGRQIIFFVKNTELTGTMDSDGNLKDLYPTLRNHIENEFEINNPTEINASIKKI